MKTVKSINGQIVQIAAIAVLERGMVQGPYNLMLPCLWGRLNAMVPNFANGGSNTVLLAVGDDVEKTEKDLVAAMEV